MKRVAVTGIGAVTPIGNDIQSLYEGLREGRNGIGYITRFDPEEYKVKVAAEVKNFDPLQYIEKNQLRKMDLYTQYAVAAAAQAVEQSGLRAGDNIDSARFGVYIGSGIGGMTTFINEAYKLKDSGPRKVSPFFVPMMIANMAAGTVAIPLCGEGPVPPCRYGVRNRNAFDRRSLSCYSPRIRRCNYLRRSGGDDQSAVGCRLYKLYGAFEQKRRQSEQHSF